jgi:hypothetical protein
MEKAARPKILLYQSVGFLAIIALSWLDEWLGLSSLIFGNQSYLPEFHVTALEMLFALVVWLLVTTSTRRVLDRMRYLEKFMKLCAWCHRVEYHGRWIRIEEFLEQGFDTPTTHGICHECLELQKAAAERARKKKNSSSPVQGRKSPA